MPSNLGQSTLVITEMMYMSLRVKWSKFDFMQFVISDYTHSSQHALSSNVSFHRAHMWNITSLSTQQEHQVSRHFITVPSHQKPICLNFVPVLQHIFHPPQLRSATCLRECQTGKIPRKVLFFLPIPIMPKRRRENVDTAQLPYMQDMMEGRNLQIFSRIFHLHHPH